MSKAISLDEANQAFARCIREVEAGEEFVITRNGQPIARLAPVSGRLTLQAISEFYAVATRKGMVAPVDAAAQAVDWLSIFPSAAASPSAVRTALGEAVAGHASCWDALLVATAAESGCTVILTEDPADGANLAGVEIHNPFAAAGGLTERAMRLLAM